MRCGILLYGIVYVKWDLAVKTSYKIHENNPRTESKVNKDCKFLGYLNFKTQNFLNISKLQDFSSNDLVIE